MTTGPDGRDVAQTEAEFLEAYDPQRYPRPSLTVDIAVLGVLDRGLATVLVARQQHPYRGASALPGGFVGFDEPLEQAAERVLRAEAGLEGVYLEQLYTFGAPNRDPRTRVVSIAYYALIDGRRLSTAAPEARVGRLEVPWEGETGGPVDVCDVTSGARLELAFDHADMLGMAVKRIRGKLDYTPVGFQLLPPRFTLRDLQDVHEVVLGRPLNKDSFRRRMLASGQLEATGERQQDVGHRPASLYRFARRSAV